MKKLLILLLFSVSGQAQYIDLSIDPNKAFGIIDNPRTEVDHKGIDADLEIGALEGNWGFYLFYGAFPSADYQNYGFGVDRYILNNSQFSLAVGPQFTMVLRKYPVGIKNDTSWGANMAWAGRIVGVLWLSDHWGVSGRFQYQQRSDIGTGILEGSVGVRYNLKNR